MRKLTRLFVATIIATMIILELAAPARASDWPTDLGPNGTGFIQAPRAVTHSLRWSTKLSDLPSGIYPLSPLLVYDNKVFVNGAGTNSVVALDARTGEVVWRFAPDPRRTGAFGGYPNPNQPAIVDGVYYTTANNGILYALDAKTGRKKWSYAVTTTDYNKAIARVAVCKGRVFFDVLGGIPGKGQHNIYAIDAKDGHKAWSTYAGAPRFAGEGIWPDFPHNSTADDLADQGRSTRRFEARPGLACFGERVQVFGEDGVLRLLDIADGSVKGEYDVRHPSMDLGFAVDGAVGITDPQTGDLLRASLNNRLVRLLPDQIETACGGRVCANEQDEQQKVHPGWRHPYGDCSATGNCGIVSLSRDSILPTYSNSRNDGVVGGAVFSAGMAIADWEDGKRVVYSPNHDGYLYAMDFDSPISGGQPSVFKASLGTITPQLRDAAYSQRRDDTDLYTSNDGTHCLTAANCQNGPWENRASNVSSPLVAGGVAYIAASMAHKMMGFDWKTGAKVFEYEVKWDDKAQYPPFGDTKPGPIVDLDLLVQTTPAHDGRNLYFAANNGVVYCISTQENIASPRKNLAILGSGVVPFIPKWKEQIGAFDYVWTPQGDWYKPSYTSSASTTAKQAAPGFPDALTPFGYKGAQSGTIPVSWLILGALGLLILSARRGRSISGRHALTLQEPFVLSRPETLVESLEWMARTARRDDSK